MQMNHFSYTVTKTHAFITL